MEKTFATGTSQGTDLRKYAAGTALFVAEDAAKKRHAKGQMMAGNVVVDIPTVTKIDINRKVPSATLSSCLDITKWNVVERASNKPVPLPSERLTRYVITSTVEKWPDGWKVIKDDPQVKPC
ncbi:secreted protein/lipoprotein [Streptomyces sp. MS2.AVA.5]|uniref:Secreted protein/lipoprotein n=1 Tax=Streptomyces achmelvichensis TaxID=3134111 RepID=A0ACC6PLF2_9ACTN